MHRALVGTLGRLSTVWLVFAAAALAASSPDVGSTVAQVHGTVADRDGTPLAGAIVQVRQGDRTLVAAGTDREGAFRIPLSTWIRDTIAAAGATLRAERLGYHPGEVPLALDAGPIEIVLDPAPLPLPGFRVEGGPRRCEGDDPERAGRSLWRAAAGRHPGGMDTVGVASYMLARTDTMPANAPVDPGQVGPGETAQPGQRGSAPILRIGWGRRIEREGYAFPVRRTHRGSSYASWSYAPLEADLSPHFGTDQFGRRHYFQLLDEDVDGWLVRFCGSDTDHPYLDGRLEISRDTLVRRAEWSFHTPEPDESAGGWALFPPRSADGQAPPLLPVESMTWRTHPEDRAIRRAHWFEGWIQAPGDSVPFLPRRTNAAGDPLSDHEGA